MGNRSCKDLINIIIFSKDRPCQLDLLLVSMRWMFEEFTDCDITVIYASSAPVFDKSYELIKKLHSRVRFLRERDFQDDVISLVKTGRPLTTFFVDDIVWKERFSLRDEAVQGFIDDPAVLCLSLRLDPGLDYCYALDVDMQSPLFDEKLTWEWRSLPGDFGYPMSLDGHIFRTSDILPLLENINFRNPNTLEGQMADNPFNQKRMKCLSKAPIVNNPVNKVQEQNDNRHGDISHHYLNKLFLEGYRISPSPFRGISTNACHQEFAYSMRYSVSLKLSIKLDAFLNFFERNK